MVLCKKATDYSRKLLSSEDKAQLGRMGRGGRGKVVKVAKKYNLSIAAIKKYCHRSKKGIPCYEKGGKPPLLDEEDKAALRQWFTENRGVYAGTELDEKVSELAKARHLQRGKYITTFVEPSRKTIKRLEKELGIKTGQAEVTTTARAEATADIRNYISFIAFLAWAKHNFDLALVLNGDATQFEVGGKGSEMVEVKYLEPQVQLKIEPQQTEESQGLKFFIKFYLIINAKGASSDPVYIIASSRIPEDEIDVYRIPQLSHHCSGTTKAYLVFCNTRGCNVQFYEWLNREVLTSFIMTLKAQNNLPEDARSVFMLDGEPRQIECYESSSMLKDLHEKHITIAKPPASTTENTQPCDAGNIFKGSKTVLRNLPAKVPSGYEDLDRLLQDKIKEHFRKYSKSGIDYRHVKAAAEGLTRIKYALEKVMTPHIIVDSFCKTGVAPFDINAILKNCKADITPEDTLHLLAKLPQLRKAFTTKGEVTDALMDKLKLPKAPTHANKDSRVVHRRRTVILTSLGYIRDQEKRREEAEQQEKARQWEKDARKRATAVRAMLKDSPPESRISLVLNRKERYVTAKLV